MGNLPSPIFQAALTTSTPYGAFGGGRRVAAGRVSAPSAVNLEVTSTLGFRVGDRRFENYAPIRWLAFVPIAISWAEYRQKLVVGSRNAGQPVGYLNRFRGRRTFAGTHVSRLFPFPRSTRGWLPRCVYSDRRCV